MSGSAAKMDTSNPFGMDIFANASFGFRNGALLILCCFFCADAEFTMKAKQRVGIVNRCRFIFWIFLFVLQFADILSMRKNLL